MSDDIKKGLAGVVVDTTAISKVNPETNSLLYRGYPVQELAATQPFGAQDGARLGDRTLHHLIAGSAPEVDLDSVLLSEGCRQRPRFRRLHRRVEGKRPLLLGGI